MSDFIQEMMTRRSVRKYKPDMVPKEIIDQIIQAGLYAPSGMGRQPVIILAITNKEVRDRFFSVPFLTAEALRFMPNLRSLMGP